MYNVQNHSNNTSTLTKVLVRGHRKQEVDNYWYKHFWSSVVCYLNVQFICLKSQVCQYEGYSRKFGMDQQNEEAAKCADGERRVIAEGKAEVLLSSARNVFYNPVQEFNRDLR